MADLLTYKCPCCGGAIEFDSTLQKMKCPYCDTEFETETLKSYDQDLKTETADRMEWEENPAGEWEAGEADNLRVYSCHSCGGEVVTDETTAATHCPFCGNPIVMTGQLAGDLRPDCVIPFKLDKEAAKRALTNHMKGKRLLPKVFASQNHIDEIKGVYVPFWLYDADADANIRYRATRVRTWSDSRFIYTETNFFSAVRSGSLSFLNVPVDGSTKIANDLSESVEPFDFSEAVDFQTAYLSGYLADKYDVTSEESKDRANQRIRQSTENAFASTVSGYTTVSPEHTSIALGGGKIRYALLPIWLLSTNWNGNNYLFAMNGQTGKMVGDLPVDKGAYWRWFMLLTLIFGAVAMVVMSLFLGM